MTNRRIAKKVRQRHVRKTGAKRRREVREFMADLKARYGSTLQAMAEAGDD